MILRALRVKPQKHAGFEPRQQPSNTFSAANSVVVPLRL